MLFCGVRAALFCFISWFLKFLFLNLVILFFSDTRAANKPTKTALISVLSLMFLFLFSDFPHLHIHYPPVHTFLSLSIKVLITYVPFCFEISGLECCRSSHVSFWFSWVFSVLKLHMLPFVLLVSFCWRVGTLSLGKRTTANAAQRPWEQEVHHSLYLLGTCAYGLWTL